MRFHGSLVAAVAIATTACAKDGIIGDDGFAVAVDGGNTGPDANVGDQPCNMTGRWIVEQHTVSTALSTPQRATNWYYYEFTQTGDRFMATKTLHCGFVVDGTATVTLSDATIGALANQEFAGPNRGGGFKPTADGKCEFSLDRMYSLRGANKAMFLTNHWDVGDPPKPLSMFPALPSEPPAMEDWDGDNMHGITLRAGTLGNRYVSQRDYTEHAGTVPQFAADFGGQGVIVVKWDSQEGISTQTPSLLRTTATPTGDGWSRLARVDGRLTVTDNALETCRNVQRLAMEIWR